MSLKERSRVVSSRGEERGGKGPDTLEPNFVHADAQAHQGCRDGHEMRQGLGTSGHDPTAEESQVHEGIVVDQSHGEVGRTLDAEKGAVQGKAHQVPVQGEERKKGRDHGGIKNSKSPRKVAHL